MNRQINVITIFIFLTERQGSAAGYRQRPFDFKVEVVVVMALSTRRGQAVDHPRLVMPVLRLRSRWRLEP